MKSFLKDLAQATVVAALIGGPLFIYMIYFWTP
jgi:ABC-type Fe3+-siderophore transport system permease subunit